jgi:hypothetical protein
MPYFGVTINGRFDHRRSHCKGHSYSPREWTCKVTLVHTIGVARTHVHTVVVGAGASGLAAAACLKMRGVRDVTVIEARSSISGHWNDQVCVSLCQHVGVYA